MAGKTFGSTLKMMSSLTRNAGSSVRHVNTSRPAMASYHVQTEEEFRDKVEKADKPVAVDFSADWCGPCKLNQPRLEAAIAKTEDKVDLVKVDIEGNDDQNELAMGHGVNGMPTMLAIKNGEIVDKLVGLQDEDTLASFVSKLKN